jgi:hypothetical protein
MVARIMPGVFGEVAQAFEGIAEEAQGFHWVKYTGLDIERQLLAPAVSNMRVKYDYVGLA